MVFIVLFSPCRDPRVAGMAHFSCCCPRLQLFAVRKDCPWLRIWLAFLVTALGCNFSLCEKIAHGCGYGSLFWLLPSAATFRCAKRLPVVGEMRLSLPVERKTPKERHLREKPTVFPLSNPFPWRAPLGREVLALCVKVDNEILARSGSERRPPSSSTQERASEKAIAQPFEASRAQSRDTQGDTHGHTFHGQKPISHGKIG